MKTPSFPHASRLLGLAAAGASLWLGACTASSPTGSSAPTSAPDSASAPASTPPNVIVMLADDQGLMDAAVYGSAYYDTPNLDRLAARGVRFTRAYSASPLCSPTRLSVLTGSFPHRYGMTAPHGHLPTIDVDTPLYTPGAVGAPWQAYLVPESARSLPTDAPTYGKVFRAAGYATAFMGKWHLGHPPYSPEAQGYDVVVGGRGNPGPPGGFFAPWTEDTLPKSPAGTQIDDAITDAALGFIDESHAAQKPFLLNLWFYDVHAPFEGKPELIAKYEQRTDPRGFQDNPIMGAMIETMDQNVGRVLDKLDALGIRDDTVVVFWSDNGGNMYDDVNGTTATNNAPLRNGKGNIYEGGIRVPAIVDWPGVTQPGTVSDALVSTIDLYPTLMNAAGLEAPAEAVLDGIDLAPVLRGAASGRDTTFFHFPHYVMATENVSASAVVQGDHKLIRRYDRDGDGPFVFELYDLRDDVGETNNLAASQPDRVAALDALLARHLADTGTPVPPKNPAYDPNAYNPFTGLGVRPAAPEPVVVAGWIAGGKTGLRVADGHLKVTGRDGDPYLETRDVPDIDGPFVGRVHLRAQTRGNGEMFWASTTRPAFNGHEESFDLKHDGAWHTYEVTLPSVGPLAAFRIDPGRDPGPVDIDWVEIAAPDGRVLKRWDFDE